MSPPRSLRNIGILAHIDAGKTSLTERLLYISGRIRSPGDIDDGTTVTDYLQVERERGITVKAAAARLEWMRRSTAPAIPDGRAAIEGGSTAGFGETGALHINLIDTPGHVDFSSEVGRSLRALDGAVVLVCAVAGVQSRTEVLYRACARREVATLAFVNKMDRKGASFERALGDFSSILDPGAVAVQLPWGEGEYFRGVVDLVEMIAYDFSASDSAAEVAESGKRPSPVGLGPGRPEPRPIPPELAALAARARATLAEALAGGAGGADGDPAILEDFVAGRESSPERLRAGLRAATLAGRVTPVLCGSAFSDGAASLLLDAVADYLPSPEEAVRPKAVDPATGEVVAIGPGDPFSGLVFKTGADPHFGRLSWLRVRSGKIAAGDKVLDVGAGRIVRITRIFGIHADRLEDAAEAIDGDIVALALGAQGAVESASSAIGVTGTTLCYPLRPILYEPIEFDEPVVSLALEPRTREDGERLRKGAAALADEDPSIRLREDPQTGRIELSGMGELHLEVAADRLARDFGARFRIGRPRVAYRELLSSSARGEEDFDRDLGGERARARVALRLGPGSDVKGFSFEVSPSLRLPPSIIAAARRGAEAALSAGPTSGFPLEGALVVLESLSLPGASLSSPGKVAERGIEIASSLAATRALRDAGTRVVEPVMRIEMTVPQDFLGAAAAAVSGRGGRIESMDAAPAGGSIISGAAPLRRLFGFASELRSATEGRAEYAARFMRFEPVPPGFSEYS
jgi:elongation factor G